jgi:DNA polymerase III delta subunit
MPAITPDALSKQIKSGKLGPVYVLVGEDIKYIDRMVDAIEATIDPADRPFAVDRLYAGEANGSPVEIASAARILPMLGDRRIVIVLRAERLLKPKRAARAVDGDDESVDDEDGDAVDFAALEDYVADPSPTATLVFVATEIDRSRRFTKKLVQAAQVVGFEGIAVDNPQMRRDVLAAARQQVSEEMTRAGRTIDAPALNLLVERASGDINRLRGDIERLLLYTEGQTRIGRDDVAEIVASDVGVEDEWAVVNAISNGDVGRALKELGRRMERGDSPHALVGQLRWWVSNRLVEGDPNRVRAAIDALLRTDLALKSSGGEDRVLLERLIVELTGRPMASRGWGGR